VWQTYDVIVHSPVQDKEGKYIRKSAYTVLHNGVLIQDNMEVGGSKGKTGNLRLRIMEIRYVTEISGIVHTGILFP
jgi:hypothetical protein